MYNTSTRTTRKMYSSTTRLPLLCCAPDFFPWRVNIAVVRWGLGADYVIKFASPSCVRFVSVGFLLATTCVWVRMVCSLHSVTTGSRDRANVSLIIIPGTIYYGYCLYLDSSLM